MMNYRKERKKIVLFLFFCCFRLIVIDNIND